MGKASAASIGSFSARTISGIAFSGPEAQTAKNTKAMAEEQKKTNKQLKDIKNSNGLVFA